MINREMGGGVPETSQRPTEEDFKAKIEDYM